MSETQTLLDRALATASIGPVLSDFIREGTHGRSIDVDGFPDRVNVSPTGSWTAVFVRRPHLHVAVEPKRASAVLLAHPMWTWGTNTLGATGITSKFLRVTDSMINYDRADLLVLLRAAFDWRASGTERHRDLGNAGGSGLRGEVCATHFIERSLDGFCDNCDE